MRDLLTNGDPYEILSTRVRSETILNGGFTMVWPSRDAKCPAPPYNGETPKTGFVVGLGPERTLKIPHDQLYRGSIAHELKTMLPFWFAMQGPKRPNGFGAWYDADERIMYLDPIQIFSSEVAAVDAAKWRKEKAVYDLENKKTIFVDLGLSKSVDPKTVTFADIPIGATFRKGTETILLKVSETGAIFNTVQNTYLKQNFTASTPITEWIVKKDGPYKGVLPNPNRTGYNETIPLSEI